MLDLRGFCGCLKYKEGLLVVRMMVAKGWWLEVVVEVLAGGGIARYASLWEGHDLAIGLAQLQQGRCRGYCWH